MEPSERREETRFLRETEATIGLVLRVPFAQIDDILSRLENLLSGRIIYKRVSPWKLFICEEDPREARP
jgi:hypothetical protein